MLNRIDHPYDNSAIASRAAYRFNKTIESDKEGRNCATASEVPETILKNPGEAMLDARMKIRGSAQGRRKIIIFNSKTDDTPPSSVEAPGHVHTSWLEPPELEECSASFEGKPVFDQPSPELIRAAGSRIQPAIQSKPSSVLNTLTTTQKKTAPKLLLKGRPVPVLPKIEEARYTQPRQNRLQRINRQATARNKEPSSIETYAQADLPSMRNLATNFFPAKVLGGSKSARKLPSMQPTPAWAHLEKCPYTQANTPIPGGFVPHTLSRRGSALAFSRRISAKKLPTSASARNFHSARTHFSSQTRSTSQQAQVPPEVAFSMKLLCMSLDKRAPDPSIQFSGHFTPLLRHRFSKQKLSKPKLNYGL